MKVICTGSYDPITKGHLDIINRAAETFGPQNLTVVVADNKDKNQTFTIDERVHFVKASLLDAGWLEGSIKVDVCDWLIDYIVEHRIKCVVRGLRNSGDYLYEANLEQYHRDLGLNTVYMSASPEYQHYSSTMARYHILKLNEHRMIASKALESYVSPSVYEMIIDKANTDL